MAKVHITPLGLKRAFEKTYFVVEEDQYNWTMARKDCDVPFIVPKKGRFVTADLLAMAMEFEPGTLLREAIEEQIGIENPQEAPQSLQQPSETSGK